MFFVNFTISLSSAKENHVKILVEIILNSPITFGNFTQPLSKICKNETKIKRECKDVKPELPEEECSWSRTKTMFIQNQRQSSPCQGSLDPVCCFIPILSAVSMSLKSSVSGSLEQTALTHLFFFKGGRVDYKTLKRGGGQQDGSSHQLKGLVAKPGSTNLITAAYVVEGRKNFC